MAKNIFVGVNGVAKKPKNIYVGVNGVARKVKAAYVGVNGVARKVWPNSRIPDENYQEVKYLYNFANLNTGISATLTPRVIIGITFTGLNSGYVYMPLVRSYYYTLVNHGDGSSKDAGYELRLYGNTAATSAVTIQSVTEYNEYDIQRTLESDRTEQILFNKQYLFDINNNGNFYIYNASGYYSIASHNLIGAMNIRTYSESIGSSNVLIQPYNNNGDRVHYHEIQMYNGSTLLRNFIPCYRITDKQCGYYDTANRVFIPGGGQYNSETNTPPIV